MEGSLDNVLARRGLAVHGTMAGNAEHSQILTPVVATILVLMVNDKLLVAAFPATFFAFLQIPTTHKNTAYISGMPVAIRMFTPGEKARTFLRTTNTAFDDAAYAIRRAAHDPAADSTRDGYGAFLRDRFLVAGGGTIFGPVCSRDRGPERPVADHTASHHPIVLLMPTCDAATRAKLGALSSIGWNPNGGSALQTLDHRSLAVPSFRRVHRSQLYAF